MSPLRSVGAPARARAARRRRGRARDRLRRSSCRPAAPLVDSRKDQVAKLRTGRRELGRPKRSVQRPNDSLAESFASAADTRVDDLPVVEPPAPASLLNIADSSASDVGIDDDGVALARCRHAEPEQGVDDPRRAQVRGGCASPRGAPSTSCSSRTRSRTRSAASTLVKHRLFDRGAVRARCALARSATWAHGCSPAGSGGSSRPRSGSRAGSSTSRSSTTARTSSASSRGRSTGCGCASPAWRARAASSSPTRRTSCARRSSRSAASSSCSSTRSWTRPPRGEFLARMREQVDRLTQARHRAARPLEARRRPAARRSRSRRPRAGRAMLVEEFEARARGSGHDARGEGGRRRPGLGDQQRILQIGRALVENAILHTPPGTNVRARRAARTTASPSPSRTTGPESLRGANHVFERFYRGDGGRASGSGLGLAIARELAEAMRGEIELASGPGRTVFTLSLPAQSATSSPTLTNVVNMTTRSDDRRLATVRLRAPRGLVGSSRSRRPRRRPRRLLGPAADGLTDDRTQTVYVPTSASARRRPGEPISHARPLPATASTRHASMRPLAGRRHVFAFFERAATTTRRRARASSSRAAGYILTSAHVVIDAGARRRRSRRADV